MSKLAYSYKQGRMILPLGLIMFLSAFCLGAANGQNQPAPNVLTNTQIVDLVKSGLSEELIISDIKSNLNTFDLSTNALVELKKDGVSDKVIEAMMSTHQSAQASTTPEAEPDNSFWLYDGDKKIALQQTRVTVDAKAGIGVAFGGSAHGYFVLSEGGPTSTIRVTNKNPRFGELAVPDNLRVAELVQLVKLQINSSTKHRMVEASRVSAYRGSQTGIPESARVPVVFEDAGMVMYKGRQQHKYTFRPENPMVPGEYAVVISGRMFLDFGID